MNKKNIIYTSVGLILIVFALFIFLFKVNKFDIITGNNTIVKGSYAVTELDNKILLYNRNNLVLKLDYQYGKSYYFDGKYLYLYDKKDLIQYDKKGKVKSKLTFKSDIKDIYIDGNKILIDRNDDIDIVENMNVLQSVRLNKEISNLIASNKNMYSLSTLGQRDGRIFSKIYMYDNEGLFYKNIFIDRPIFKMKYIKDNLIVVFDEYIKIFDKSKILKSTMFDGVKDVGISSKYIFVITKNNDLLVYDNDLKLVHKTQIDDSFIIYSNNKNCIIYNKSGYGKFDGKKIEMYSSANLKSICGDEDFFLVFDKKIERIR